MSHLFDPSGPSSRPWCHLIFASALALLAVPACGDTPPGSSARTQQVTCIATGDPLGGAGYGSGCVCQLDVTGAPNCQDPACAGMPGCTADGVLSAAVRESGAAG
jgi:hypothetical protein